MYCIRLHYNYCYITISTILFCSLLHHLHLLLLLLLFADIFVSTNQIRLWWKIHLSCISQAMAEIQFMMTSSNRNIFRVTGPLCGEFTGDRWIPLTTASDAELWCFRKSAPKRLGKHSWSWWFETPSSSWWHHSISASRLTPQQPQINTSNAGPINIKTCSSQWLKIVKPRTLRSSSKA